MCPWLQTDLVVSRAAQVLLRRAAEGFMAEVFALANKASAGQASLSCEAFASARRLKLYGLDAHRLPYHAPRAIAGSCYNLNVQRGAMPAEARLNMTYADVVDVSGDAIVGTSDEESSDEEHEDGHDDWNGRADTERQRTRSTTITTTKGLVTMTPMQPRKRTTRRKNSVQRPSKGSKERRGWKLCAVASLPCPRLGGIMNT